jgi:hypothetical protein
VDKQKISQLEDLVVEKLSKYASSTVQISDGVPVHLEIALKFRDDRDVQKAIEQLKLNPTR